MAGARVENYGSKIGIDTTEEASQLITKINTALHEDAVRHSNVNGLEAICLRAKELVLKISFILAAPEGMRTYEHVLWAYALVCRDMDDKMKMVIANDTRKGAEPNALRAKILHKIGPDGQTEGRIKNTLKSKNPEDVKRALEAMVADGTLRVINDEHKYAKHGYVRYFIC